jgi:hypothetical protein
MNYLIILIKFKVNRFLCRSVYVNQTIELSIYLAVSIQYVGCKKKTGNENFPNVNLVLSTCQLVVCLTIPMKYSPTYLSIFNFKNFNFILTVPVFSQPTVLHKSCDVQNLIEFTNVCIKCHKL